MHSTITTEKVQYSQRVPAVEQASRILLCLAKSGQPQLSLTEICNRVGIHKSKGYSILNTLMDSGLVVRNEAAKAYGLGPAVLFLSRSILDKMDLQQIVAPYLQDLAAATQSTALLGLIHAQRVFIVAKHEMQDRIGVTIRVGHRYPLTWGAHGKAIVAGMSEQEREQILAQENLRFYGYDQQGELDSAALHKELQECRKSGYAKDLGKVQAGISAVSSAVLGTGSVPIGCVVVVGTFSAAAADAHGAKTAAAAGRISSLLGPTIQSSYGLREQRSKISRPGPSRTRSTITGRT